MRQLLYPGVFKAYGFIKAFFLSLFYLLFPSQQNKIPFTNNSMFVPAGPAATAGQNTG